MTKQTKTLIFTAIAAVVLGICVSFFVYSNKNRVLPAIPAPPPKISAPPPPVEVIPSAPKNVSFTYAGSTNIPTTLPGYHFSWKRRNLNEILSIANLLGFADPPVRKRDKKNTIYSWFSPSANLYLFDNGMTQIWKYALVLSKGTSLGNAQSEETGKNFLASVFALPKNVSFLLKNSSSGPFDGLVIRDSPIPTLHGYSFSYMVDDIPVVTTEFNMSPISIIIDSNGIVRTFSFSHPPIVESSNAYRLISPSDAVTSLKKGLGILIFVGMDNSYAFFDSPPFFTSVSLSSFSLVYYPDNTTTSLLPFYIFEGEATNSDGSPLRVSYAVSAIEEQNF